MKVQLCWSNKSRYSGNIWDLHICRFHPLLHTVIQLIQLLSLSLMGRLHTPTSGLTNTHSAELSTPICQNGVKVPHQSSASSGHVDSKRHTRTEQFFSRTVLQNKHQDVIAKCYKDNSPSLNRQQGTGWPARVQQFSSICRKQT